LFEGVLAHLWMWFSPRSRVSESRDKVKATGVSAQNLTNTRWSNAPVAGSLRVRQPCGDDEKGDECDRHKGAAATLGQCDQRR